MVEEPVLLELSREDYTFAPAQPYTIDRFRPEDAYAVARCYYAVYGDAYSVPAVYNPDALVKAMQRGSFIPLWHEHRTAMSLATVHYTPHPAVNFFLRKGCWWWFPHTETRRWQSNWCATDLRCRLPDCRCNKYLARQCATMPFHRKSALSAGLLTQLWNWITFLNQHIARKKARQGWFQGWGCFAAIRTLCMMFFPGSLCRHPKLSICRSAEDATFQIITQARIS